MEPSDKLSDLRSDDLREEAESRLADLDAAEPEHLSADPDMTREEMIRELRLQHIELELQDEQLDRYRRDLEQSRERYRDLYFQAPVGYLTLDSDGVIGEPNYRAAELLGDNRDSLRNKSLLDCIHPDSRTDLQDHLRTVFNSSGVHHCKLTVRLPTGDTVHLKMLSIAVDDRNTGDLQCRSALFDITEQQRTHRHNDRLEAQLQQSHRLETIGRLANGIAHDFNNLLTLIIGYSKLAINQLDDDHPLARHVREINKAGHHAGELIEQLLAFSRSDGSRAGPLNVNEIIDDMALMFDRLTGDDIELQLRLHDGLGAIDFDTGQFQQVLLDLVINARDAIERGGNIVIRTQNITLTDDAAAQLDLAGGPHVVIEVEDDGQGIPPEVIPHIFEPFFTTKSTDNNVGCGLSTTYGIVNRHGGAIDIVTEADGGTTFCVYLPRVDESDCDLDEQSKAPVVLVVEDQADLREFASLVLADEDLEVLNAQSPTEALQLSQACGDELALVVTDVTMPGLSGPQLFERIRRIHPDTAVLYISGYDQEHVCRECGVAESDPFLEKPFGPERLVDTVQSLLDD